MQYVKMIKEKYPVRFRNEFKFLSREIAKDTNGDYIEIFAYIPKKDRAGLDLT